MALRLTNERSVICYHLTDEFMFLERLLPPAVMFSVSISLCYNVTLVKPQLGQFKRTSLVALRNSLVINRSIRVSAASEDPLIYNRLL